MPPPCPHCGYSGPSLDPGTCGRCGVVFSRLHSEAARKPDVVLPIEAAIPEEPDDAPEVQAAEAEAPRTENRWALPLAFGVAFVLNSTGCGRRVVYATASNWAHELGHAVGRVDVLVILDAMTAQAGIRDLLAPGGIPGWLAGAVRLHA